MEMTMDTLQTFTTVTRPNWQIVVPARAVGNTIMDNAGNVIARCPTDSLADGIAAALNRDAATAAQPVHRLDLGSVTIGMVEQGDGSIRIVP
jgi:hypothetical protein